VPKKASHPVDEKKQPEYVGEINPWGQISSTFYKQLFHQ